eukprot:452247_1
MNKLLIDLVSATTENETDSESEEDIDPLIASILQDMEIKYALNEGAEGSNDSTGHTQATQSKQPTNSYKLLIELVSATTESIEIKVNIFETTPRKIRFYIYQCNKTDEDDLGTIEIKKNKTSGQAIIDLEDIDDKSFEIALYAKENDKNPTLISNKLAFIVTKDQVIQTDEVIEINNVDNTENGWDDDDDYKNMYPVNTYEDIPEDEKKQTLLALEIYGNNGITCDEPSCKKLFDPNDIFICINVNCKDDCNAYCRKCGAFKHENSKKHSFDPKEPWIKCLTDILPDKSEYGKAKATANVLVVVHAV